ncbi:MAG: hypothetical protein ACXW6J_14720, partial [Candidatus Binatia bacterium]
HAGAGRHPDPSSTWIPFFNGMTDSVRHLDSACAGMTNQADRPWSDSQTFSFSMGVHKIMIHSF